MKQVSEKLNAFLNSSRHFICADIYELRTRDGGAYRFTDGNEDVAYNGRRYRADLFAVKRSQTKTIGSVSVDKLTLTIYADKSDKLNGEAANAFAHSGGLDRAQLFLSRVFFDEQGQAIGHVALFGGVVEIQNGGGLTLTLSVKAETQGLNVEFPRRRYYPQTPFGAVAGKDSGTALVAPFIPSTASVI